MSICSRCLWAGSGCEETFDQGEQCDYFSPNEQEQEAYNENHRRTEFYWQWFSYLLENEIYEGGDAGFENDESVAGT